MPDKIWLHKDTKYSTGDIVCGYQYGFAQGIEDEGGIENFVEYVPVDALIEKALDYIENNIYDHYDGDNEYGICGGYVKKEEFIKNFKNYMKG